MTYGRVLTEMLGLFFFFIYFHTRVTKIYARLVNDIKARGDIMRYHYEKPTICISLYGEIYICDHPVYDRCTLFRINDKGLAVIQQRFNQRLKTTRWGEVDPWLSNDIYLHPGFKAFFDIRAGACINGLYPTVSVRQIMWALKMKPLPRERWETCFDRREI